MQFAYPRPHAAAWRRSSSCLRSQGRSWPLTKEALELAFPILRADSRLYRNYVYHPGPPLAIPIAVYGGASDSSIAPEQLDRWHDQTTGSFIRREFEGGHFYLKSNPDAVLVALRRDLDASPDR